MKRSLCGAAVRVRCGCGLEAVLCLQLVSQQGFLPGDGEPEVFPWTTAASSPAEECGGC